MKLPTPRPPASRRSRLLLACSLALLLAALSCISTAGFLLAFPRTAVGGQLAMHGPADAPDNDAGPPEEAAPQQVGVSVPVGPHVSVPILYYHYVRTVVPTPRNLLSYDLSISPQLFARQMALLHVEGAHTISLATLMAALQGQATLPQHPVVLTFDDGYADFATTAEPVLARYGFIATDFVVSGFIGRHGYMTAAQVLAMDAAGMVIGSHTVHHVDLARVPAAQAALEIDGGKAALEQLLGHPVLDFAYPYGGFNAAVLQLVQQAGFRDAASTIFGDAQSLGDRYLLRRTELGGSPSLATFAADAGLPAPRAAEWAQILGPVGQPAPAKSA
jgi:peptidoglycan/xylan/chitin deacetylase (PgdA/CDA1 family)